MKAQRPKLNLIQPHCLLLVVLLITSVWARSALASSDTISIKHATGHWPPYSMDLTKEDPGIDIDLVREITRRTGIEIFQKKCSFKRCLAEGEVGGVDIVTGLGYTDERARYLDYIQTPYSNVNVEFYVRKGDADLIQNYEDLYQLKVGRVVKSHYFEPFNSDNKIQSYEASEESILLLMLANKRLDVIIGTNPNLDYEALKLGLDGQFETTVYSPSSDVTLHLAFSRKSPFVNLKPEFERVLKEILKDGTLDEIHAKYK